MPALVLAFEWRVAFAIASAVVAAALYAFVGHRLGHRHLSPSARPAMRMFQAWWYLLAAITLVAPAMVALHAAGRLPPWAFHATSLASMLLLCGALYALLCYLLYVPTGTRRFWAPLGLGYALLAVAILYAAAYVGPPQQLQTDGWRLTPDPEPRLPAVAAAPIVLLLIGPQVVGAGAYLRVYRRSQDATQRYRVVLVAGSIFVWFGSALVASLLQVQAGARAGDAWQVASRLLGLAAAYLILLAYYPPSYARARGIRSLADEGRA